jgi:hypothetical protein
MQNTRIWRLITVATDANPEIFTVKPLQKTVPVSGVNYSKWRGFTIRL